MSDSPITRSRPFAPVGILVNPMSGRDVRRLAARATNMTHEAKRDLVARVAAGADACGASDIFVAREPFRIASAALEHLDLRARHHVLTPPIRNTAEDTETAVAAFLDAGCQTIVSLGGDGTNRAIVRALGSRAATVRLIPLSTGTNNVFPVLAEPTIAGMVAAPVSSVYPNMGSQVLIMCFVVVVIGGIGSVKGALIAAILVGLVDTFGKVLLPQLAGMLVYVLMAIVLLYKPEGLFKN